MNAPKDRSSTGVERPSRTSSEEAAHRLARNIAKAEALAAKYQADMAAFERGLDIQLDAEFSAQS